MPVRDIRGLALIATLVALTWPLAVLGQAQPGPQQRDTETLVRLVDDVSTAKKSAPSDVSLRWVSNHFIKGQDGNTYIPFTLSFNSTQLRRPSVAVYIRVVDKRQAAAPPDPNGKRPTYAWDELNTIEVPPSGAVSRAIAVPPGTYDVFIAAKVAGTAEDAAAETGLLRRDLTVPDYTAGLVTSSVILANEVEILSAPIPPDRQKEQPYVFGPMRIVPASSTAFQTTGELQVVFWIYGARPTPAGKPDVEVEYLFHQRAADGEKYFNRTEPQALNAATLPANFSLSAGHQLPGSAVVPLEIFPAGEYRLEIRVNDKVSGESITRNVNFTVLPS